MINAMWLNPEIGDSPKTKVQLHGGQPNGRPIVEVAHCRFYPCPQFFHRRGFRPASCISGATRA